MRALLVLLLSVLLELSVCQAQTTTCTPPCTQQQLLTDVGTQFPDNTAGAITPAILRNFLNNLIYSTLTAGPVTAGANACFFGTSGVPGTCTAALSILQGGTGATTQPVAAVNILPAAVRAGDIGYWSGTGWVTIPGNTTTPAVLQESAAGVPSWATNLTSISLPTPIRAGDVVYYNGTQWVTLAGNNSGTNYLSENPSGVPSWATPATGVTSVTCGTGLSGGTITTTGTCAVQISSFSSSLSVDIALNNTANFIDGPSVAQGTSGTWWAAGTVTMADTAVANFQCKLWDGTTVIASGSVYMSTAAQSAAISLSGPITAPAANIRMSCKDATATTGLMKANYTGAGKDSTVSAMRLQ